MAPHDRALRNFAYLSSATLLARLGGFVTTILISRSLSIAEYGAYSSALTLIALINIVLDFGVSPLLTQQVAAQPHEAKSLMGEALGFRLVLAVGLAGGVVLIVAHVPVSPVTRGLILIASASLLPTAFLVTFQPFLNAIEQLRPHAITSACISLFAIPLTWVTLQAWGVWGAGLAFVIQAMLQVVLLLFLIVRAHLPVYVGVSFHLTRWREMARAAVSFFLLAALTNIYWRIDVLMLLQMAGEHAVGIYAVAYRFIETALLLPPLVGAAIFPSLSRLAYEGRKETVERIAGSVARYMLLLALLGASLLVPSAPTLVTLLFRDAYLPAIPILQVLIWTVIFTFVNAPLTLIFYAYGQAQRIIWIPAVMAVINIMLNLVLIPRYSGMGAAIATVITEVLGSIFVVVALHRARMRPPVRPLVTAIGQGVAAGAAAVIVMLFVPSLVLQLLLGFAVFGGVFVALRGLQDEDWRLIKRLLASVRSRTLYGEA